MSPGDAPEAGRQAVFVWIPDGFHDMRTGEGRIVVSAYLRDPATLVHGIIADVA